MTSARNQALPAATATEAPAGWHRGALARYTLRWAMRMYLRALRVARRRPARPLDAPARILLTLSFHGEGWPIALLGPLAASTGCRKLTIVSSVPVAGLDTVDVVNPPAWLRSIAGQTLSRLATFVWVAVRTRPDVIGGVHLLLNGLVALLLARFLRARALYICVGGPIEVVDGGLRSENRAFAKLPGPDAVIERDLLTAAASFDTVVTMGTRAADYFRGHGVAACHAIPSGVSRSRFYPDAHPRTVDVILVARLVPLKRIDLFVHAIEHVARTLPAVRAVIIGQGPERGAAEALVNELGIAANVEFHGHVADVASWYRRARIFLLTSDNEGVSIALLEAMLSGAVPVVSAVGDLGDVVDGITNGRLVHQRSAEGFAAPIVELLRDAALLDATSAAACESATRYDPSSIAGRWDVALADMRAGGTLSITA